MTPVMIILALVGIILIVIPEYQWYFVYPELTRPQIFWKYFHFYGPAIVCSIIVKVWVAGTKENK